MNVDKQALRQTAEKAQEHGVFNMDIHSETVLALLDELEAAGEQIAAAECREHEALNLAEERGERINEIYNRERREFDNCVREKTQLALDLVEAKRRIAELESNPIATLDVQSGRADGNKFALVYSSAAHKLPDDVYYLCVAAAGIGKGDM